MRRVLVPLDGSKLAETILLDARRLAGPDGELVLVRDADWIRYDNESGTYTNRPAIEEAEAYLRSVAEDLWIDGIRAESHCLASENVARVIDESPILFHADMIACATHGRGPLGRFWTGGISWKVLTHSPVPVLLRHVDDGKTGYDVPETLERRILVPLDGSRLGEAALPLASQLASEWHASIYLTQVTPNQHLPDAPFQHSLTHPYTLELGIDKARAYLSNVAEGLPGDVHTEVLIGPPTVECLVQAVNHCSITDVVMGSHGRTGLARIIQGSVADGLIHHLRLPIVVVPSLAAQRMLHSAIEEAQLIATGK